jgi:hypothetical protein
MARAQRASPGLSDAKSGKQLCGVAMPFKTTAGVPDFASLNPGDGSSQRRDSNALYRSQSSGRSACSAAQAGL